ARAASVAKYFIEQGISPSRLVIAGYADTRPVASNDTPQGRQKNRRIDILITKK
ncbi:MAG: flagellar motor protein MotB, partial [Thermodesulfobium narugense]